MSVKPDAKNQTNSFDDPFRPDLEADSPSIDTEESSEPLDDINNENNVKEDITTLDEDLSGGVADKMRSIDRDGFVSMETARNSGLAVLGGSMAYINTVHRGLGDAVKDAFPDSETYNEFLEIAEDAKTMFDPSDYKVADKLPEHLKDLNVLEYGSLEKQLPFDKDTLSDEIVHHLNKDVTEYTQFEGIETAEGPLDFMSQVSMENAPDIFLTSFDQIAHGAIAGAGANMMAATADRFTDEYDPKKIAVAGMSTAVTFALLKEGIYEGGPGLQFDLSNTDVRDDLISDTLGAAYGTYSFHKNKTATEQTEPGITGRAARKAGRTYGKAENILGGSSSQGIEEKEIVFEDPEMSFSDIEEIGSGSVSYRIEGDRLLIESSTTDEGLDYDEPEMQLEGETIKVQDERNDPDYVGQEDAAAEKYSEGPRIKSPQEQLEASMSVDEMLEPSNEKANV